MEILTQHSNPSASQHLLLDTGAPGSICSKDWLQKCSWKPLKKLSLSPHTSSFRFIGHSVCALYGVQLTALISDLKGNTYALKVFAYVHSSAPIPFLLGLTDQRRLSFDICHCERFSSHLKISALHKICPLTVTSHVWLRFVPTRKCSSDLYEWDNIISKSIFDSLVRNNCSSTGTESMMHLVNSNEQSSPDNVITSYISSLWRRLLETADVSNGTLSSSHSLKLSENSSLRFYKTFWGHSATNRVNARAGVDAALGVWKNSRSFSNTEIGSSP